MKIYITGIGVISAIGQNVTENVQSLQSGRTGICRSQPHDLMLGEVSMTNESIIDLFQLQKIDYSRTSLLGLVAAKEAWGQNALFDKVRTGLISATCVGGLDRMEKHYEGDHHTNIELMTHDNGRTTERIAEEIGMSGYIGTISTACSSGANAIMHGARLIEGNKLDRVLVGGADPLTRFNMKGFGSLMIYDAEICKPFDDERAGLNLGEAAGFLVLENEISLLITGNKPLCVLSGWNNSSDAFHQTASSANGEGASLAMKRALQKAGIEAGDIDYVNAHGTGTQNNDLSESMALKNIFGFDIPPFSSTKGFTGHTLGAAGAIEAVYCVQSIISKVLLPNLNFTKAMVETGFVPETLYKAQDNIKHVLSNSFGFGGNCTSLIFSKS